MTWERVRKQRNSLEIPVYEEQGEEAWWTPGSFPPTGIASLWFWHSRISTSLFLLYRKDTHSAFMLSQAILGLSSECPPQLPSAGKYAAIVSSSWGASPQKGHGPQSGSCWKSSKDEKKHLTASIFINKIATLGVSIGANVSANAVAFTSNTSTILYGKQWWQISVPKYFMSLTKTVFFLQYWFTKFFHLDKLPAVDIHSLWSHQLRFSIAPCHFTAWALWW